MSDISEIFVRFSELALKSPYVRHHMEKQLSLNIRLFLEKREIPNFHIEISRSWGRIILTQKIAEHKLLSFKEVDSVAQDIAYNVFGLTSVSPVIRVETNIDLIKKKVLEFAKKNLKKNSTFAVRVKRFGKHDFTSKDLEVLLGGEIYDKYSEQLNLKVDLTQPDYLIMIEVKDNFTFVYDQKYIGFGGLPQGTQGLLVSILRGSLADAIAAFLMCKRGVITIPIIFSYSDEKNNISNKKELKKQLEYFALVQPKQKPIFFEVNFTKILEKIGLDRIKCSTCDRVCLGIIERIIEGQNKKGVTLGNSDTTLLDWNPEMKLPNENIPIYYPLIALDQQTVKHPFHDDFKNSFCLDSCPGYINQQNKEIKPLTDNEISELVASADYNLITTGEF
ncbi:MAG TPA: THUMP domain-containing protein [Candidatus Bathyarchaeia archaeon]|nr:THUMP domain-containing protein [Candidatus Bathyarchaeia archaeon]